MRIECLNCKSSSISEIDVISQDIDYTKGKGRIISDFQCDQCEEYFRVCYEVEIIDVNYK